MATRLGRISLSKVNNGLNIMVSLDYKIAVPKSSISIRVILCYEYLLNSLFGSYLIYKNLRRDNVQLISYIVISVFYISDHVGTYLIYKDISRDNVQLISSRHISVLYK